MYHLGVNWCGVLYTLLEWNVVFASFDHIEAIIGV